MKTRRPPLRAAFEKVVAGDQPSFAVRRVACRQFTAPYHYHPEVELIHICRGHGRRLIGSAIAPFGPGDLVLLAPDVPHMWRVAPDCLRAETIYVQFLPGFLGAGFFELAELRAVRDLLAAARGGVTFSAPVRREVAARLARLPDLGQTERLLELLAILHRLSQDRRRRPVGRVLGRGGLHRRQEERLGRVFERLHERLTGPISQAALARELGLSAAAFSRLFKRATGRRFVAVVNELRIAQVCRLLAETARSISEIAYACGFETLSHFNSTFRQLMRTTPHAYRRRLARLSG